MRGAVIAIALVACHDRAPRRPEAPSFASTAPPAASTDASLDEQRSVPTLPARALVLGEGFACALMDAGAKCWGRNASGELGLPDTKHRGGGPDDMGNALPFLGLNGSVAAVGAGGSNACALGADGAVTCWGADYGSAMASISMPGSKSAVMVASGREGQCAVLDDASVVCWRGFANANGARVVTAVDVGASAKSVHLGRDHTCALLTDGAVKCWGENGSGELGIGTTRARLSTDPVAMGKNLPRVDLGRGRVAKALALGPGFSCALLDNGLVKCWGENASGRLGRASFGPNGTPGRAGTRPTEMGDALPAVDLGERPALAIAIGANHGCALLVQGDVACWGFGYGLPPVTIHWGRQEIVRDIAASWDTTCTLSTGGRIACWGRNDMGQLGLGDARDRTAPTGAGDALGYVDLGSEAPK